MLRIKREMNAKHPRRKKFLIDLSHTIFVQKEGDRKELMEAARLEGPPTRAERVKFVRRVVGEPVAKRMILVLNTHHEIDSQCRLQAEAAGLEVDNLTVADIAYPLITKSDRRLPAAPCLRPQRLHLRRPRAPAIRGTINFHSTSHNLSHYQSLRGTSEVEAVHSVLD